jgi:hypothetical protein
MLGGFQGIHPYLQNPIDPLVSLGIIVSELGGGEQVGSNDFPLFGFEIRVDGMDDLIEGKELIFHDDLFDGQELIGHIGDTDGLDAAGIEACTTFVQVFAGLHTARKEG